VKALLLAAVSGLGRRLVMRPHRKQLLQLLQLWLQGVALGNQVVVVEGLLPLLLVNDYLLLEC
jgi:hypothetical protein